MAREVKCNINRFMLFILAITLCLLCSSNHGNQTYSLCFYRLLYHLMCKDNLQIMKESLKELIPRCCHTETFNIKVTESVNQSTLAFWAPVTLFQEGKVGRFRVHQLYHIKLASIIGLAWQLSSILIYNRKDSQVQECGNGTVKGKICSST